MKKMKRHNNYSLFALGAIVCFLTACSQEEAFLDNSIEELQIYTLYLDADVPNFDTVRESETRASGNSWENGDVIYIAFSNGGGTVVGNATFKSSLGAFQFSSTSLSSIADASCRVYYFRGGSFSVSNNMVTMDKFTAIFADTSAKYTCSNNTIVMRAAFKPYTWRLCFKGPLGTQVKLKSESNIFYNTSLNLTSGSFTTNADSETLQVKSDGYTSYIYGLFTVSSNRIEIEVGGVSYSRRLEYSNLSVGESGYFSIPTTSNLYGWKGTSGTINGHEYVDLGLPSGTLWATCNIGATKPEEYGGYYAWGETNEKYYYDWSTYTHCDGSQETCHYIGDDIAGTDYDVAHVKWGGSWRMPTTIQQRELIKNCTKEWMQLNGVNGIKLTGPNGNTIFLPAAGLFGYDNVCFEGDGYYWSSTFGPRYYEYSEYSACSFIFNSDSSDYWNYGYGFRDQGCSVRAVISPEKPEDECPVAQAIDLGLPSGTKWASWNIGATKPEEYGGYYAWGETEEKDYYYWNTYKYFNNETGEYIYIGDDIAGTEYDVAHVRWGGSWSMPTTTQQRELLKNCTREWIQLNGVNGIKVTGPNGSTIFLPAAGLRSEYNLYDEGEYGFYWSSSFRLDDEEGAFSYYIWFNSGNRAWGDGNRFSGLSVRAVCP